MSQGADSTVRQGIPLPMDSRNPFSKVINVSLRRSRVPREPPSASVFLGVDSPSVYGVPLPFDDGD